MGRDIPRRLLLRNLHVGLRQTVPSRQTLTEFIVDHLIVLERALLWNKASLFMT